MLVDGKLSDLDRLRYVKHMLYELRGLLARSSDPQKYEFLIVMITMAEEEAMEQIQPPKPARAYG